MKTFILIALTTLTLSAQAGLKEINELKSPYTLGALPYSAKSLEPFIDAQTMNIHHGKHHKAYVDKLNDALKEKDKTLIDLLKSISKQEAAVRNNAGGHWNHTFFWNIMSGKKADHKMSDSFKNEINKKFGSFENFKKEFETKGIGQFGSGWVWLIRNSAGELQIVSTPNQDNPLMDDAKEKGWPILGADVWEHAYYLKYKNERNKYLESFWSIVNWSMVEQLDAEVKKM